MTILTILQTYYAPHGGSRVMKRKFNAAVSLARKQIKSSIRKAKSRTIAAYRRQYFISHAYADFQIAARRNEDIFINTIMAASVIGFAATVVATDLILLFFQTAFDLADATKINFGLLILQAGLALTVLSCWLTAFLMNMSAIAVMEGATLKKHKSSRRTIQISLQRASRVTNAWFMGAAALFCPPLAVAAAAVLHMNANDYSMVATLELLPGLIVAAIIWAVFILMNYSLVPYVALFEPALPLKQTFSRSRQLVLRRGRIFILMGYLLLGLLLVISYLAATLIERAIGLNLAVSFSVMAFALLLTTNGVMVTLYRKRRLARKY